MLRRLRARLTYANVMATTAMFIALGGSSYAAITLPRNSVGSNQIRKSAVGTSEVRNRSLRFSDFRASDLVRFQGPKGDKGDPGPLQSALPAGVTVRGRYVARFTAGAGAELGGADISFGFALTAKPVPHFVARGAVPPVECPGNATSPQAIAGHLCVYEGTATNRQDVGITDVASDPGTETFGAGIIFNSSAAGQSVTSGSWAVTGA